MQNNANDKLYITAFSAHMLNDRLYNLFMKYTDMARCSAAGSSLGQEISSVSNTSMANRSSFVVNSIFGYGVAITVSNHSRPAACGVEVTLKKAALASCSFIN